MTHAYFVPFRMLFLSTCLLALPAGAEAASLIECRDARLARMDAWSMQAALQAAGGRNCRVQEQAWAQTVACDQASATVFGLPVHELRGEYTNGGVRRLVAVSRASEARARSAAGSSPVADGLRREIEAREDGASVILCSSASAELEAESGAIVGPLPKLPVGAHGWRVCAEPVDSGSEHCINVDQGSFYRIASLSAGDYRLRATPLGAADDRLGAVLAQRSNLKTGGVREDVLLAHVTVRAGALTEAGELEFIRLPEP